MKVGVLQLHQESSCATFHRKAAVLRHVINPAQSREDGGSISERSELEQRKAEGSRCQLQTGSSGKGQARSQG